VFDVGFLRQIPGMKILCPASLAEQQEMLRWAVEEYDGPVAIRYPRGTESDALDFVWDGDCTVQSHRSGEDVTLVTYGSMLDNTLKAAHILAQEGVEATVLRLQEVSNLHSQTILERLSANKTVVVVEEVCSGSGIREALAWELTRLCPECTVYGMDLGADFVPHGNQKLLYKHCGLDSDSIVRYAKEVLRHEG
jgi:1-deoxy-D-xylulose-5-phosphate synthase